MHIYTLVITRGPRRSAVAQAMELLAKAVPPCFDYWGTGGWFADRLGRIERPQIDAWYAAEAKRRARFEAEHRLDGLSDLERGLVESQWTLQEMPHWKRRQRLEQEALIDRTRLTSKLPSPLPESMIPAALITPMGDWRLRPPAWKQGDPRWSRWVNETIDRHRGGHCVVIADCHC